MVNSFASEKRGNVATTFALTVAVLLGAIGAAVDYSRLTNRQTALQRTADSAALAGAQVLSHNESLPPGQRESAAVQTANQAANGAAPTAPEHCNRVP